MDAIFILGEAYELQNGALETANDKKWKGKTPPFPTFLTTDYVFLIRSQTRHAVELPTLQISCLLFILISKYISQYIVRGSNDRDYPN